MNDDASHRRLWEREKDTWPNHEFSSFVTAAGIRWHVQRTGQGPTLLLIHGTGASSHSWRDLIPIFAQHYQVLSVDLPGHGFTDAVPAARRSIAGMSDNVNGLLRALDFRPCYCVGHSAGAVILCRMGLARHIDPRVIIGVNGAFFPLSGAAQRFFSPLAKLLASTSFATRLLARHATQRENLVRVLAGTGSVLDETGVDLYRRLVRDPEHVAGALGMMGAWDLEGFTRDLRNLRSPLVLIAASNDRTVPAAQAVEVANRVANGAVVTLPNLGHLAHEEAPALVAQEIMRICGEHTGAA